MKTNLPTLLSQPGCGSCIFVKKAFESNAAPLAVVNIRAVPEWLDWMAERELKSTPVLVYPDGEWTQNTQEMYDYAKAQAE
ncbi:NrdH-like glutaredoxin [Gordonia phage Neville]|uniref:NrdH-like glutaredoxin n=1 Tax=Gordonia phage Neville TaxID=2301693 RepID=A0A385E0C6_9CAUD|nr:NrdH-like glutaredoxin [Gordonia phage Neville]AXQ64468.1 NrdH-like glutaredoxin [Gordonia phage Neville]